MKHRGLAGPGSSDGEPEMDNITDIQNAKALKRMGVPLNTPIAETRYFSESYSKHWFSLMKAHDDFLGALAGYVEVTSLPKWRKLRKSFNGIHKAIDHCTTCIGKLDDPLEQQIIGTFLIERAIPFATYWADAINAVEDGVTLTITPADWPRWTEED
jgi:hypothetical protein